MMYLERIQKLQTNLHPQQVFLLSRPADIEYFTGLITLNPQEREAFFIVSATTATLLYPSFSPVEKISSIKYHPGHWPSDLTEVLTEITKKENISEIFIDKSSLFLNEYEAIASLKVSFSELKNEVIWQQRVIKDTEELLFLQKASQITSQVMEKVLKNLTEGMTEKDVAQEIDISMRRLGAESTAFPSVVAFGEHSALPHHQPTDTKLNENTVVLIDIGAKYNSYCGDMTRTIWFGKQPPQIFMKIEKIVKKAYQASLDSVKADIGSNQVDTAARDIIKKHGYGDKFIHTTGHGVGLEIHEQPSLYYKKDVILPQNAVVTIEPGIYLEGKFGYRHENMILVEKESGKELTQ